ncbi:multidrug resistance-associated protein 5-like [Acanthaster planci]|uniref:Multidrug resistance-associated protein 5-like n=1 Tax=Acanthaster planci TaxID=133434 RepID=A0A8B7YZE4_ACAPL|nr:multidrug resistance-associated protein 5-like [Acanthaster planci]XP_022098723.1 multidrug resistance-associated protein 5-like [Acanthaster planci]
MSRTETRRPGYHSRRDGREKKMDTLKVLLPVRPCSSHETRSAMDTTGLLGTLVYSFLTGIFWKANLRRGITEDALKRLMSDRDAAVVNCDRFEQLWRNETDGRTEKDVSLKRVIFRFIRTRFLTASGILVIGLSSGFLLTAYVLYTAIIYMETADNSIGYSVALAFSIFGSTALRVIGMNFMWYSSIRTAVRVRNALMLTLYKKVSRLRNTSEVSVGEMVNICVNDMQRLFDATIFGPILIAFPLVVLLILVGCVLVVGIVPTLAGIAMLIIVFAFQTCLAKLNVRTRQKCVVYTDRRTRMLNEVLNCIKLIKMYAWEESFQQNITEIRKKERSQLQRSGYLSSYTLGLALSVCPAVILTTAICYKLMGSDITAAQAFTLMQLFGSLSTIMYIMPMALKPITESVVSVQRIQPILLMKEVNQKWGVPADSDHALVLTNASFSWDAPPQTTATSTKTREEVNANSKYTLMVRNTEDGASRNKEKNEDCGDETMWEPNVSDNLLDKDTLAPIRTPVLRDISLVVPKSHLIGICGAVGSGKSSLLSSVLDQMNLMGGIVALDGTFAYASQQAWIMNATIQDNILFGEPFDKARYQQAIFSCCLERDLEIMSDGDMTEIGERGVNVSGGQKQRISLARAYYSDRDIYLLDDPLSAVDAHVGKHIFTHCIRGALRGKTILFVSHQLQYLRDCDYVVLMRDGTIAEQGTHEDLMAAGGEYARLIDTFHGKGEGVNGASGVDGPASPSGVVINSDSEEGTDINGIIESGKEKPVDYTNEIVKLMNEEDRGSGMVPFAIYRKFVRYAGGPCLAIINVLLIFLSMLVSISKSVWLSIWIQETIMWRNQTETIFTNASESRGPAYKPLTYELFEYPYSDGSEDSPYPADPKKDDPTTFFVLVYIGIFFLSLIILGITCIVFIATVIRATTRIHECLLRKIMRCPMSFFDTTPLGRVLNRFSKDMDEVDVLLPTNVMQCLIFISIVILMQVIIAVVLPQYLIALVLGLLAGLVFYVMFRKGYCEVKRYDNTSRSKLVSHISATMQGLVTIRAYGQESRFTARFEELLNINTHMLQMFTMAPRWVAVRMDLMAAVLVGVLTLLVLLSKDKILSTAMAAMALYQAVAVCGGLLQQVVVSCTQTESSFISVERMLEYIEKTPSEADACIPSTRPDDSWPANGDLQLQQVKMRYRPGLPLVLKGIMCHIRPREKIGIVGRTGSGKSSLGVSLFRLVENAAGEIFLDGVNIANLGLHDLRSRLSVIPQDPVLFAGTVRFNLDPLNQHSDEEIWNALEKAYIKQTISALDNQLQAPVTENGENFSVGERQLMCMARVLLRNSKVLLMDEATAAIDTETDSLIQQTIREAFKDCTMLIIAHRLNTVLDCDRIMVMDKGQISEFGKPEVLLSDPGSLFNKMLAAAESNQGNLD